MRKPDPGTLVEEVRKIIDSARPGEIPAGIRVLVRLYYVAYQELPGWQQAQHHLDGILHMALRKEIPGPEVLAGPLGKPASTAIHQVWPFVRALALAAQSHACGSVSE